MNYLLKKKSGFTLLEVLFAVVILSIALSTIFVFLNNMFGIVKKTKNFSYTIEMSPLVFSSYSPLLNKGTIKSDRSEEPNSNFIFYTIHSNETDDLIPHLKYLKRIEYITNKDREGKHIYGNLIFQLPQKKEQDEKKS